MSTGQDQMRNTDQTATNVDQAPTIKASNVTVESQGAASLQPAARLIEARPPQTLAEQQRMGFSHPLRRAGRPDRGTVGCHKHPNISADIARHYWPATASTKRHGLDRPRQKHRNSSDVPLDFTRIFALDFLYQKKHLFFLYKRLLSS
jgi:hypothetical protein